MLAETMIARLWPRRHEGGYVRGLLRSSIADARSWRRMTPGGTVRQAAIGEPPPLVDTAAVREEVVAEKPQTALFE